MVNVFVDKQCGCEVVSDAYKQSAPFEDDSLTAVAFEVASRYVKKGDEDFGISCNQDEDAEAGTAGGAGGDAGGERVLDVVDCFGLVEAGLDKKVFQSYFSNYMKNILLPDIPADKQESFKKDVSALFKKMIASFADASIYFGANAHESEDPTKATPIYAYWKDGEEAPRFIFLKDGLKEVKY